jgi:hypothetical protein
MGEDVARNAERLTFTRAQLEGSRAELARVERERDGVRAELARQAAENEDLAATLAMRTAQLGGSRAEREELRERLVSARAERDEARHELAHAEFRTTTLRAQLSACQVTNCALCRRPIWCSQPREPLPGATGYFRHIGCAAEASPPDPGAGPREEQTNRRSTVTEIEKYAVDLVQIGAADCAQDDMNENGDISDEDWPTARNLGREMAAAIRRNQESFLAWYRSVDGGSHPDGA